MTTVGPLDPDQTACPKCQADPGDVCRQPNGRKARTVHDARRKAARNPHRATPPAKRPKPPNAGNLTAADRAKGGKATAQARRRRRAELEAAAEAKRAEAEAAAIDTEAERVAADAARYAKDRQRVQRRVLDATAAVAERTVDAAENMLRPAGYDDDGRPRTAKVEAYTVNRRTGERTRVVDPTGAPVVEERPDLIGYHSPEDVDRLTRALGSVVNALRLEEGKPTGITRDDTAGASAVDKLGEAGVEELVEWAARNLPRDGSR